METVYLSVKAECDKGRYVFCVCSCLFCQPWWKLIKVPIKSQVARYLFSVLCHTSGCKGIS